MNISIIILHYNKYSLLFGGIDLLKPYIKKGDEIIIADDGTPDFLAIAKEKIISPYIKYVHNNKKGWHAYETQNMAIHAANNDIILKLDCDVWIRNDILQIHKDFHKKAEKRALYGIILNYSSRDWDNRFPKNDKNRYQDGYWRDAWGGQFSYRKEDAIEIGLYDEDFDAGGWGHGDQDFAYRLVNKANVKIFRSPDAITEHQDSVSSIDRSGKINCELFLKKHGFSIC